MPRILSRAALPRRQSSSSSSRHRRSSVSEGQGCAAATRPACHTPQHYTCIASSSADHSDNDLGRFETPSNSGTFLSYLLRQQPGSAKSSATFLSARSVLSTNNGEEEDSSSSYASHQQGQRQRQPTSGDALADLFMTKLQAVTSGSNNNGASQSSSPPPSIASSDTSCGRDTPSVLTPSTSSSMLVRSTSRVSSLDLTSLGGGRNESCCHHRSSSICNSVKEDEAAATTTGFVQMSKVSSWGQFVDVAEEDAQIERYRRSFSSSSSSSRRGRRSSFQKRNWIGPQLYI